MRLSAFPQFTGKQKEIVEGLMRRESVQDMKVRLATSRSYIYNIRYKAKKLGITFNPPDEPNPQPANHQPLNPNPPPDAARALTDTTTQPLFTESATPNVTVNPTSTQPAMTLLEQEYSLKYMWSLWGYICRMSLRDPVARAILTSWVLGALSHNYWPCLIFVNILRLSNPATS